MIISTIIPFLVLGLAQAIQLKVGDSGQYTLFMPSGRGRVEIQEDPWDIAIYNADDECLLQQFGNTPAQLGFGIWVGKDISNKIYEGYQFRIGKEVAWFHATQVSNVDIDGESVVITLKTSDPTGAIMQLKITAVTDQIIMDITATGGHAEHANRIGWGFKTSDDDGFFGFGERFNLLNQRGQKLYCWVEDGGWGFNIIDGGRLPKIPSETYIPMPWFMSPRSYGFLLDTTFRTDWDLDTADLHALTGAEGNGFYFESEAKLELRARVFVGESTQQVLESFTDYTGRSLVPPKFQFGPWNQFSHELPDTGKEDAMMWFAVHDVPSTVHLDSMHFFPAGAQLGKEDSIASTIATANSFGIKPMAYFNSMVDTTYEPAYSECLQGDYFLNTTEDKTYVFVYKGAGPDPFTCSLLDFTKPETKTWYKQQMQGAIDMGYAGWMYDYGEYVDFHTTSHSGLAGNEHHNMYPLTYQQTAFEFFESLDEDPNDKYAPDYVYYVRSGYVGTQKWTWNQWTGDPMSDWSKGSGLPAQITAQLNIGLSGIPFTGSDIGGFVWWLPPNLELWSRWAELGLFSPTMHVQGGGTSLLGIPKTCIHDWPRGRYIWRKLAKLRMSLFPYIYTLAHDAHETGIPLMRHHLLDFPDDATAVSQGYQYCFGESILVAPVVVEGMLNQTVYLPTLPAGQHWIDAASVLNYDVSDGRHRIGFSTLVNGGQYVTVQAPLDTVPFFVRSGSIIPTMDPSIDTVNEATSDLVTTLSERDYLLHLWAWLDESGSARGQSFDGSTYEITTAETSNLTPSSLSLKVSDPQDRTIIAQIAINPSWVAAEASIVITDDVNGDTLRPAQLWEPLTNTNKLAPSGWTYDSRQSVLWIRATASNSALNLKISLN